MSTLRRLGTLRIADLVLAHRECMHLLMKEIIVYHAEHSYLEQATNYICSCDSFDEIEQGANLPHYEIVFEHDAKTDAFAVYFKRTTL